ncbi:prepilin-type N-terminal cleavage/methylation domain-containing protein [Aquabacterium soli]|uniref:Prepilin-type N-terminal cleavage/methylation domain-containing protein n=1 Tax=Aquabacterium soli TaxID=2493092 RepID=A0A426V685_9BURK|nr:prepilin-type N-terminal cleavage/methylation domain-containing protein [Aquabacterium soli]RRS02406.1 prepilin-type N-terminal cleavage/methylation domain-containing protein [Aquabacterium soli]
MLLIRRVRQGFTLIELLVVLAIVAVLLTLAVPRYLQHVDRSKETVLLENLQTTRRVIDRFYGDKGRYPASLDELVESRYLRGLPYDPVLESDQGWQVVPVPEGYEGMVYDLHSTAPGNGADGRPYADW